MWPMDAVGPRLTRDVDGDENEGGVGMKWVEGLDRRMEIQTRTVPLHFRGARPFVSLKIERLMGVPLARASGI